MNSTERAAIGVMFAFGGLLWAVLIVHGVLFGWPQPTCTDIHSDTPWLCYAPTHSQPHTFGVQVSD
jgi:hypothetical protein